LVSHRWQQLVQSPPLLASLELSLGLGSAQDALMKLQSLCSWLERHAAAHTVQLRMEVSAASRLADAENMQAAALLTAALASCCASTTLQVLQLAAHSVDVHFDALGLASPTLRRLSLETSARMSATRAFGGFSQLQWLRLRARQTSVDLSALPQTLTRLD
jgi:hypothetical protein